VQRHCAARLEPRGDGEDHRHEQHDADLEEQRDADDHGDQGHRPRQPAFAASGQDGRSDLVSAARIGQQLAEHRAKSQHDANGAKRAADPLGNESTTLSGPSPAASPTNSEPIMSARNACILT
jgi:hypothetical protein